MARRKTISVETSKTGKYVWQDFKDPQKRDVLRYRTVKKGGHVIRVAVLKKKGPRGGRTVAVSIGHPKTERASSDPRVNKALRRARKKGR